MGIYFGGYTILCHEETSNALDYYGLLLLNLGSNLINWMFVHGHVRQSVTGAHNLCPLRTVSAIFFPKLHSPPYYILFNINQWK